MGAVSEPTGAGEGSFSGLALAESIFPRSAYSKSYRFAVHVLAASQPLSVITQQYLDKKTDSKRTEILMRRDQTYGLTAAHVALLAGRVDVLRALIKRGADPRAQDYLGWTLAHHAVVLAGGRADHPLVQAAVELMGGDESAQAERNKFGGSYKDFIDLFRDSIPPQDEESVCKIEEDGGVVKACSAGEFRRLTGTRYVNGLRITTEGMYAHWKRHEFNQNCSKAHPAVAATVDTFCIKRMEQIDGYGLFATSEIPQNARLKGFYGGEFLDLKRLEEEVASAPERLYDTLLTDSQDYRSDLALMNHGLPTVELEIKQYKGIPQLQARTLVSLSPGDELVWDYGYDYPFLVTTPMVELHPGALEQQLEDEKSVKNMDRLKYPYNTPASWVYLYAMDELNFDRVIDYLDTFRGVSRTPHIQFIEALNFIDKQLTPETKPEFKKALVHWNQTCSAKKTNLALDALIRLLKAKEEAKEAIANINRILHILAFFQLKSNGVVFLGDQDYRSQCIRYFSKLSSAVSKKLCLDFFNSVQSHQAEWVTLWGDLKHISDK
ncbi:MAG: hypothetical protein S4CHLAM2_08090 [Chlamydiales bacterium]|nr:hypothetical protein [Chlamydiales bacterium]